MLLIQMVRRTWVAADNNSHRYIPELLRAQLTERSKECNSHRVSIFRVFTQPGSITDMARRAAGSTRSRMTNSDIQPLADVRFRVIE